MSNHKNREYQAMELFAPPQPMRFRDDDPTPGSTESQDRLQETTMVTKSIAGAASLFNTQCRGGDKYENNCAHFLSDAFIRAGYNELGSDEPCISSGGRCGTAAKRPIRAREMWCWFKKMATDSDTKIERNTGVWAVFQLDENSYWGGHVVIIDTDANKYYGTGNYPAWNQYSYKW